jgi:glycerophosphoryl diester phosphodiesterase
MNDDLQKIGFPLETASAILERYCPKVDTYLDVKNAYDHQEAAGFLRRDWDHIVANWNGPQENLLFLQAFVRMFAD